MRKILVFRGGALGDFIVTLPALALLRKRWPAARIELVGNATAASLAVDCRLIDAAHSQHDARWRALFASDPLPPPLEAWLADFDLIVNFWPDPGGELKRHLPLRSGQQFLTAAAMPELAPAAAHYCAALSPLGVVTSEYFHLLAVDNRPHPQSSPLIAIHPGSGSPRKNWPLQRWAGLCAWLKSNYRANLIIVTGEAESADALAAYGVAAHNLRLPDLASRLAQCSLFLGHDSGVSHLAAACGTPCVLLFGPTDPLMWAPPAPRLRMLRRDAELASISLADVQREVTAALSDRT